MVKPYLKWSGGKTRLTPYIVSAFGKKCNGTFYSPFLGGGAAELFMITSGVVKKSVLADGNKKIINTWNVLKEDIDGLMKEIKTLPVIGFVEKYNDLKLEFNQLCAEDIGGVRQAALMIWLNHACYNGLWRENKAGVFNTPVGKYTHVALPDEANMRLISKVIGNVEFRSGDFSKLIVEAKENDYVFCDPPYVPLSATASFKEYGPTWLGDADQFRLTSLAREAADRGAKVVICNHKTDMTTKVLYPNPPFVHASSHAVARQISCKAERHFVEEIIVSIGPFAKVNKVEENT